MGGGNWRARSRITVVIPSDLLVVIETAQNLRSFSSKNATIQWLLESHPYIQGIVDELQERVYAQPQIPDGKLR